MKVKCIRITERNEQQLDLIKNKLGCYSDAEAFRVALTYAERELIKL